MLFLETINVYRIGLPLVLPSNCAWRFLRALTRCLTARDLPLSWMAPRGPQGPKGSATTCPPRPLRDHRPRPPSPQRQQSGPRSPRTRPPTPVPLPSRMQAPPQDPAAPRVERPPLGTHPARLCLPLPGLPAPEEAPDLLQAPRVAGRGPWPSGGQWEADRKSVV